ncbi:hypothetical protein M407DRAFT_176708 [Tulasnella calospora MUT 4182]|uniref:Uncharacterized protein n=1 Tax=Tulasnella calospora MUT 4182 TaxID=1051891 RepID=A0A0C3QNR1_9AGAM|nr:hypothetical protein M407DRAFT_176708 [Tulasnella calospora MUT 4182]
MEATTLPLLRPAGLSPPRSSRRVFQVRDPGPTVQSCCTTSSSAPPRKYTIYTRALVTQGGILILCDSATI